MKLWMIGHGSIKTKAGYSHRHPVWSELMREGLWRHSHVSVHLFSETRAP